MSGKPSDQIKAIFDNSVSEDWINGAGNSWRSDAFKEAEQGNSVRWVAAILTWLDEYFEVAK